MGDLMTDGARATRYAFYRWRPCAPFLGDMMG